MRNALDTLPTQACTGGSQVGQTCGSLSSGGSMPQTGNLAACVPGSSSRPHVPQHRSPILFPILGVPAPLGEYLNSCLNTDCLGKCLKVPHCPGGGRVQREELTGPPPHSSRSGSGRGSPSTDPRNPRTLASHSSLCLYTWGTLRHAF